MVTIFTFSDWTVEDAGAALPDRCEGIEFDAISPDEKGTTFFFKGMEHCFITPHTLLVLDVSEFTFIA